MAERELKYCRVREAEPGEALDLSPLTDEQLRELEGIMGRD